MWDVANIDWLTKTYIVIKYDENSNIIHSINTVGNKYKWKNRNKNLYIHNILWITYVIWLWSGVAMVEWG